MEWRIATASLKRFDVRKVIAPELVSLDGVMADPSGTFQFMSEEREEFDELSVSDALLLGRVTYGGFASARPNMMEQYEWPRRTELQEYTDMMNGYPKYVVSTTLEEPLEWNNSKSIKGNVAEEISRFKQESGGDIPIFGSGDLVNTLLSPRTGLWSSPWSWVTGNGSSRMQQKRPLWNS